MSVEVVSGDLLTSGEQVICQQLNCLAVRPHGLSEAIAKAFPYANVYASRRSQGRRNLAVLEDQAKPGTIVVSEDPAGKGPIVIGLYGQFDYGKGKGTTRTTMSEDNATLRVIWFTHALQQLSAFACKRGITRIAFPYGIGCGLAGGDWTLYEQMLEAFAHTNNIQVVLYKLK